MTDFMKDMLENSTEDLEKRTADYRDAIDELEDDDLTELGVIFPPDLPYAHRIGTKGYIVVDTAAHNGMEFAIHRDNAHLFAAAILAAAGDPRYVVMDLKPVPPVLEEDES